MEIFLKTVCSGVRKTKKSRFRDIFWDVEKCVSFLCKMYKKQQQFDKTKALQQNARGKNNLPRKFINVLLGETLANITKKAQKQHRSH